MFTISYIKQYLENGKSTPLSVKMKFSKTMKSLYFLMVKAPINPNGEKR